MRMPDLTNPYRKTPARQDLQKLFLGSNAVQINFQHYLRNILKIYCVRVSIT